MANYPREGANVFESYKDIVDICELCEMLRISKNKAYDLLKMKKIRSVKDGRKYIIPKTFIQEYLEKYSN